MQAHESKNFYQVIALTFLTMCFGLCMYIAKDAKMQYFENLHTFAKMYYIHGINKQNAFVNNINSKNNHQPIIIIKNK